jgi:2,4-dienoyl-CoA reductase-like NADH-dependent reductase (Old Yellow Enzyme family)
MSKHSNKPIKLISGRTSKNRIVKAAMSENMALNQHKAGPEFINLYSKWANGGAGMLITGNVMIDHNHVGEPHNIVIDTEYWDQEGLTNWASAGTLNDTLLIMQLNHPGKQTPKFLTKKPVAPSAIGYPPPMSKMFNVPRELEDKEIVEIIKKFGYSAKKAEEAGFSGVQIHGAHGYLVSQFLSPKHNQRTDRWGGSPENRMKFLIEIYQEIRNQTSKNFIVSLKMNSADFQKGGFTQEDSIQLTRILDDLEFDFIEISGGTYEAPAMMGAKKSTIAREAYFLDYAKKVKEFIKTPLMLTGGFRSMSVIEDVVKNEGIDLIGMGRPIAVNPNLPNEFFSEKTLKSIITPKKTNMKLLDQIIPLEITWYTQQIHRMGKGLKTLPNLNVYVSVFKTICELGITSIRRNRT